MSSFKLEVCVDSFESFLAATVDQGCADRIELCSALTEGGLTPSHGLITATCRRAIASTTTTPFPPIHVLIRPRPGDFLYTDHELEIIKTDILTAATAGAHGIVIGFLTPHAHINTDLTRYFVDLCSALRLDFTFHRAFDVVRDQHQALSALLDCHVPRVLTSGGHPTSAFHAVDALAQLVEEGGGKISVMPGLGVTEGNAATIVECTGCREIHGSFRQTVPTRMQYIHPRVHFSGGSGGEALMFGDDINDNTDTNTNTNTKNENNQAHSKTGGGVSAKAKSKSKSKSKESLLHPQITDQWNRRVADTEVIRRVKAACLGVVERQEEQGMR